MKHAYPLPFLEALLDTAERADLKTHVAITAMSKVRHIMDSPPSVVFNRSLKELVPLLAWEIHGVEGLFFGATITV